MISFYICLLTFLRVPVAFSNASPREQPSDTNSKQRSTHMHRLRLLAPSRAGPWGQGLLCRWGTQSPLLLPACIALRWFPGQGGGERHTPASTHCSRPRCAAQGQGRGRGWGWGCRTGEAMESGEVFISSLSLNYPWSSLTMCVCVRTWESV